MKTARMLNDLKVNVKFKISALWVSVMLCYLYGDFFTLFVPGRIEHMISGNSGVGATTPIQLLMFAILMSVPAVMVFLSLTLPATINRITNILLGIGYTAIMILVITTSINDWMIFYLFLGMVEMVLTSLIAYQAWKWPN